MENNSYFEMLQAHFALKRRSIESIENHPRVKKQSLCDLAYEEALFEGLQEFSSSRVVICDVIVNRTGDSVPEVVLSPILNLDDILSHYPVYQCSLFDDNKLDSVMFQIVFKDDQNQPNRYMIYPFNPSDDLLALSNKVSKELSRPVELYPLFIREAGSLTWKSYLSDLKD